MKWWNLLLPDNFLGMGVSSSHLPIHSCSSFQHPRIREITKKPKEKKRDFPLDDPRPDLHQLFSCQTFCCNYVNKSNLQIAGHTFIYKQSVGDLTLAQFLKHVITPRKRQVFHYKYLKTPHWRFQKKAKL